MKKLIYKVTIPKRYYFLVSDFEGVFEIYDDGTYEFPNCTESERKEKRKMYEEHCEIGEAVREPALARMRNPRYPKAFARLTSVVDTGLGSGFTDEIEYFGEGEPWEPDPEMEGAIF